MTTVLVEIRQQFPTLLEACSQRGLFGKFLVHEYIAGTDMVRPIPYVRADWFVSVVTEPSLRLSRRSASLLVVFGELRIGWVVVAEESVGKGVRV